MENLELLNQVWSDIYNKVPITGKSLESVKAVFDYHADKLTQEKEDEEPETK